MTQDVAMSDWLSDLHTKPADWGGLTWVGWVIDLGGVWGGGCWD